MTSIIKVNNIQNSSGTAAMAIDGSSNVTFPQNVTFSGTVTGDNGGGLVKLLSATISSAVSSYDISSTYINSTYDDYLLLFYLLPSDDSQDLRARVFESGSVVTATKYAYELGANSSSSYNQSNSVDFFRFNYTAIGNSEGEGITGALTLSNVNSTVAPFVYTGGTNSYSATSIHNSQTNGGGLLVGDRFRLYWGTSNIASGIVKLYGIVK